MTTQTGESEYFGEICRRFAASGRLHLLLLEAGGQTLAMSVWLRGGEGFFLFKISYNEQYARYGPGALLHIAGMEYFHAATDADWIDTCTCRDNEIILRLYPDRRQTAGVFMPLSRNPLDMSGHSLLHGPSPDPQMDLRQAKSAGFTPSPSVELRGTAARSGDRSG